MNKNNELFKNALIFGLILAGTVMLCDLLIYSFDLSGMGVVFRIISILIWIAIYISFFIWCGRKYRNKYFNGYINYGKAFVICFLIAVVSTLALALYYYLFYNFFDPQRATDEYNFAKEWIESNNYIPDENKNEAILNLTNTIGRTVIGKIFNTAILSVIIGSISALFVRKKEKINDIVY